MYYPRAGWVELDMEQVHAALGPLQVGNVGGKLQVTPEEFGTAEKAKAAGIAADSA